MKREIISILVMTLLIAVTFSSIVTANEQFRIINIVDDWREFDNADIQEISNNVNDGLVSYWNFDEGKGVLAYDKISGNHGNIYGATYSSDSVLNYSINFDGIDDYIDCGNDSSLDMKTDDMTIAVWVKINTNTRIYSGIVGKGAHNVADEPVEGYGLFYNPPPEYDKIYFWIANDTTRLYPKSTGGINLLDGKWHFIVVTIDRDDLVSFYVDTANFGREDISSFSNEDISNLNQSLFIGMWCDIDTCFKGNIDEVRIYNRVLEYTEIEDLYHIEEDPNPPEVSIIRPKIGNYYKDDTLTDVDLFKNENFSMIYGNIEVWVYVQHDEDIERVEFYVDDNVVYLDSDEDPEDNYYKWDWKEKSGEFILKAEATDINGLTGTSDEMIVKFTSIKSKIDTFLTYKLSFFLENHPHMFPLLRQIFELR